MPAQAPHATLSDDTMVPAEMAAVYLGMSPAELAESYKLKRTDGRAGSRANGGGRIDKGAKGQSQPTAYAFGALRELRSKQPVPKAPDAVSKAGLLGWLTVKLPFFAELEPRVKRGRRVLIGSAWEGTDAAREPRFADLVRGRIRVTWLTSSEAAASLWSDEASHRAFATKGLAVLESEAKAIEASIAATAALGAGASTA